MHNHYADLRSHENDYPLQRDVNRLLRELNPTSVLIRGNTDLKLREIVDHASTAYKTQDGSIKFRTMSVAHETPAPRYGRGGLRLAPLSRDCDDSGDLNPLAMRQREQRTRRVGREARTQLRKSLVQSERRLRLCKNGVQDPYSDVHRAQWEGYSPRSVSALAGRMSLNEAQRQLAITESRSKTPGVKITLGALLPAPSRSGEHVVTAALSPPMLSAIPAVPDPMDDDEELDGTSSMVAMLAASPEAVSSFFFTQPSFILSDAYQQLTAEPLMLKPLRHDRCSSQTRQGAVTAEVPALSSSLLTPTSQLAGSKADLHVVSEPFRLSKRFKPVQSQAYMTRDYRPPETTKSVVVPELSSKLRSHPKFRLRMVEGNNSFYASTRDELHRKANEQKSKFDKKYRALDVGGDPLPFRATAVAILHHVEAVIQRDEKLSSRQDRFDRHLDGLRDLRAYLTHATHHPKVLEMFDVTVRFFGVDKAAPTPDQFFHETLRVLDDLDFLFHDVLEGAVHIATVYGVSEQDVVAHARTRAARFIHDRPTQLLAAMQDTEARTFVHQRSTA
jgi:hypothetical protein